MNLRHTLLLMVSLGLSSAMVAAPPTIAQNAISCLTRATNARITAHIDGAPPSVRVYFHSLGQTCGEYYVEMRRSEADPAQYSALLPLVSSGTEAVSYQIRVQTGGGKEVSAEPITVAVRSDCAATPLSPEELLSAKALTLGLTSAAQHAVPCDFKCNGVTNLITANGELKPNEECRLLLLGHLTPWYTTPTGLAAAAGGTALAAGIVLGAEHNSKNSRAPSPARP